MRAMINKGPFAGLTRAEAVDRIERALEAGAARGLAHKVPDPLGREPHLWELEPFTREVVARWAETVPCMAFLSRLVDGPPTLDS
jgi:hypothetical protein